jgi:hypothetical protein
VHSIFKRSQVTNSTKIQPNNSLHATRPSSLQIFAVQHFLQHPVNTSKKIAKMTLKPRVLCCIAA